jgi:ElaB/YqjD/DUF883 family membrane-anchored ribosome-binding protein
MSVVFERIIMSTATQADINAQEQRIADIKTIIAEAEEVLAATADQAGEKLAGLRARVQARLQDAKARLTHAEELLVAKTKAAAKATDAYVHESPWAAVGIAAGLGFLLGVVIGRR